MCSCNTEDESSTHYLLRCPNFAQIRIYLMNEINIIKSSLLLLNDIALSKILLYGDKSFNDATNSKTLNLTIQYIHMFGRFDVPTF